MSGSGCVDHDFSQARHMGRYSTPKGILQFFRIRHSPAGKAVSGGELVDHSSEIFLHC
jgi:hypothetical protein